MITKEFFKNESIERRLVKEKNLEVLETILEREGKRLQELQRIKFLLYFGKRIPEQELPEVFSEVEQEVNKILNVIQNTPVKTTYHRFKNINKDDKIPLMLFHATGLMFCSIPLITPLIGTYNKNISIFSASLGTIINILPLAYEIYLNRNQSRFKVKNNEANVIVAKSKETTVIPAIAHEYTHLILAKLEIPNEYNYLEEGLARKIQRDISIKYKEKLNNLLFEYDILNYDVGEMKSVYKWICDLLEKEPRKELLKVKARETDWIEKRYYNNHDKPTPHAIGNTTFKIMQEINYEVASYEASQFAKIFLSEKAYLKIISTN